MTGDEFIVRLAEKSRSLLGGALEEEVASRAGRPGVKVTVSWDPGISDDGPVVTDSGQMQVWDNGTGRGSSACGPRCDAPSRRRCSLPAPENRKECHVMK
jgi:hypothetical protein